MVSTMDEAADLALWDQLAGGDFVPDDDEYSTMTYSLVVHHGESWYRPADLQRVLSVFPNHLAALEARWGRYHEVFSANAADDESLRLASAPWFEHLAVQYRDAGLDELAALATGPLRILDSSPPAAETLSYRGWRQSVGHDVVDDLAPHVGGFVYDDLLNNIVDAKEITWFLIQPLTSLALDLSLYMDICAAGGRAMIDAQGPLVVRV